jgi:hypothetical protein
MNIPILSFNKGEISPQCDARSDVESYNSACRHLENMTPRIYGSAERRPGLRFVYHSEVPIAEGGGAPGGGGEE